MSSTPLDEARDYAFADKALALRDRAGLTQRELAELLDVSVRAIQAWEAGLSYPGAERLKQLIALYLERRAFGAGREEEEAAALWESVRGTAARHRVPFDPSWFASLRSAAGAVPATALPARWHDWGEAPAVPVVYGRAQELATLARWVREERCREVLVLGVGGIGKTTLAARLSLDLAPEFAVVYWRSLRNALPVEEWLAGAIAALSAAQAVPPEGLEARLRLVLELLRAQRALLVLDNLETVIEPGAPEVRYREGYEGYGVVLQRLGESAHQGCLLVTSREKPLRADEATVRSVRLEGLGVEEGRALLGRRDLAGDAAAWQALVERYGGNPLALHVVGETIAVVFAGDIAAFLAQEAAVFGGIRQLLEEQVERLSALEQAVLTWLAVEREPVGFAELVADLGPGAVRGEVVEAVEALQRRSVLERGAGGTFTLQPVVLEYVTARLVERVWREVVAGEPAVLVRQALLKAQAKDYVRRSQERLIAQPLLEQLSTRSGNAGAVERRLLELLAAWRGRPRAEQGYGPGNVVNLLRLLRGELRGLDLSRLAIRQAYLQEVEAQDARLVGAHLAQAVLAEAFDYPTSVALSADGAYLAAGTGTGEVRLWRLSDRTPLWAVQGHRSAVYGVALSADGHLLASGSLDGTVKLWAAAAARGSPGQLLATLQAQTGGIWNVDLSGDGRLLASASQDGTICLWETASRHLLATFQGHTGLDYRVALSGDGHLLASGSQDGTVRLWEAARGHLLASLQGHTGGVWDVDLSGDGRLLASGGVDGTVKLWATAPARGSPGQLLATLQGHSGVVFRVALSADGRRLVSASYDGTVKLWEVASASGSPGQLLATLQGHTSSVLSAALSKDGRLVASASYDGTVKLWEADGGRLLATLQGRTGARWGVALSGDGQLLASGSLDGTVRLWAAPGGELVATLHGQSGARWGVALSGDGRLLASGSLDGTVRLWAARAGQLLATLQGHTSQVRCVALSADGQLLASGGVDGVIELWEATPAGGSPGQLLATLQGHTGLVWGVALSGDGELLASGGGDGTVRLWAARAGHLLATLQGHTSQVRCVALSGDGRLLASGSYDGTVKLWAAPGGQLLATLQGHTGVVYGVALSADGRLLASGSYDGTVKLWEVGGAQLLTTLQGHSGAVRGVALSADGQLVASGSLDGTVKLWAAQTGACLRTLRGDRRYERMDITGLTGVTEAQRTALLALGAVEKSS